MNKILFSTDSTCDLPQELLDQHKISVIQYKIVMGDKVYTDKVDITPEMIYAYAAKAKKVPKTSGINTQEFISHFTQIREREGDYPIFHIGLSDRFSVAHKNAVAAAKEMDNIYVVDSETGCGGLALLLLYAIDLYNAGKDINQIVEIIQKKANQGTQTSFVLEALDFLYKGGRCSMLKLLGANILRIRPTIGVINGRMDLVDKMRGKPQDVAKRYIYKLKEKYGDKIDLNRVFFAQTLEDLDFTNELLGIIKETFGFKEIISNTISSTITTHVGKNAIGLMFLLKD